MLTFITFLKMTDQGIKDVKNAPQRLDAAVKAAEATGGKMTIYYTTGEYDYIAISEFPFEEAAAAVALRIYASGNVKGAGLRVFTRKEFGEIVNKLQ